MAAAYKCVAILCILISGYVYKVMFDMLVNIFLTHIARLEQFCGNMVIDVTHVPISMLKLG